MATVAAVSKFEDASEECIICLSSFDDDSSAEVITLTCGHRYHLECVKAQLRHAKPNPSMRLIFSGCRCAKCNAFCDHPALSNLTRQTDLLRAKVDRLIEEQLQLGSNINPELLESGRRTLAYYLCTYCREPYFGGTIECADTAQGELSPGEDRLCPKCSPKTQTKCANPALHRAYHVWKCRYCCNVASHVCYGTVHFCSACHDRNTVGVRSNRSTLESLPCPGKDRCRHPIADDNKDFHANGSTPDCEQVYYCAWCESSKSLHPEAIEHFHGSSNLLQNQSGNQGLRYWQAISPRIRVFSVEQSEVPVDDQTSTNFVSSFQWCAMAQTVDLRPFVHDPSQVTIEVAAKFMARTDCPSVFRMEAILLDSSGRRPLLRKGTPELDAPPDGWERVRLELSPTPNAAFAAIVVYGKDSRFWQGDFGSKVADCSVRVVADSREELGQAMRGGIGAAVHDLH